MEKPKAPRNRKSKFSDKETQVLVENIEKYNSTLFGRTFPRSKPAEKEKVWVKILENVNAVSKIRRTLDEIKIKWKNIKSLKKSGEIDEEMICNSIAPKIGSETELETALKDTNVKSQACPEEANTNLCRACLAEITNFKLIFEDKIHEKLIKLAKIEIKIGDGLPTRICNNCHMQLIQAFTFQNLIQDTDSTLRKKILRINQTEFDEKKTYPTILNNDDFDSNSDDVSIDGSTEEILSENYSESNKKIVTTKKFNCVVCGQTFSSKTNLINHNKMHRGKFKCKECGKLFLRHSLLTVHLRVHGIGEKKYGCNECNMKYYGKSLLEVHKRTHTGERPLKCPECEKCFALPRSLSAHYLIHTGEKKHVCEVCLKAFSHSQSLVSHRRVHTGERPYVCSVCGLTFKASGQLQIHSRTHTNEKPYACTLCDKSFNSGSSLAVHLRRHGEDRTYLCTTCGKSFKTKIDLTVHFRSHTGEKPYSCKISGCEKKYRTQSHLSVHLRSHTGEKNYNCKVCSKSFVTSAVLKKHMFIHEGIKRYECAVCGHRFTQGSTLKTHMKTHQKAANT